MNERLKHLMLESGYAAPEIATRAHKLAELIIQDCVAQVALIGITNYENEDISWTTKVAIDNIKQRFGVN